MVWIPILLEHSPFNDSLEISSSSGLVLRYIKLLSEKKVLLKNPNWKQTLKLLHIPEV